MQFIPLDSLALLEELKEKSLQKPQIIFKHSTRCSISKMVLNRFNQATHFGNADYYLLLVIEQRNISNTIEQIFGIKHESPQVLLIKNGNCIYSESHHAITVDDIVEQL
jgi:bacillithiol system protein YtxJ